MIFVVRDLYDGTVVMCLEGDDTLENKVKELRREWQVNDEDCFCEEYIKERIDKNCLLTDFKEIFI